MRMPNDQARPRLHRPWRRRRLPRPGRRPLDRRPHRHADGAAIPEYRQSRQSFGINVLGTLVVEVEASDGTVGFAVTTGGELGAFIVEKHLARFIEGRRVTRHREDLGPDVSSPRCTTAARASC